MRSLFNFLFNAITRSGFVLVIALLSVNYLPNQLFKDFPLEPLATKPVDFDSVIPEWNSKLSDGDPEFIQVNNINGPESIAIAPNGLLYTGLADGRLVELNPSKQYQMRTVLRIKDQPGQLACKDNVATRAECGRLLQLRFVNGTLFGVEANSGLYMLDIKTGSKILLGPKPLAKVNIYNSFVFDPKEPNIVYMTISSTKWNIVQIMWSILEHESSAKVIAFDVKTGKRVVLTDNRMMVNGIDVDVKRDRLVFAETMEGRVSTMSLKQVRAAFRQAQDGEILRGLDTKTLIPTTPGNVDNIVIEGDLAYLALPFVKRHGSEFSDHTASMPKVRKAMCRAIYLVGKALEYVALNFYNHPMLELAYNDFLSGHIVYRTLNSQSSAVLEYNLATGATRFFGSETFGFVSEAVPDKSGNLYMGSFRSPFLVKQKLPA